MTLSVTDPILKLIRDTYSESRITLKIMMNVLDFDTGEYNEMGRYLHSNHVIQDNGC